MPHIELPAGLPGIRGPMAYSPETARPINELANLLLVHNADRPDQTLSKGDRELIATYVSALNDCYFCQTIHGAVASHHLGDDDWSLVHSVKCDYENAAISPKMKAILTIAGSVQQGGKYVTADQVAAARAEGATDRDIHDTVLIAGLFCLCNRYVDGLATEAPATDPSDRSDLYRYRATVVAQTGYTHEGTYLPTSA